MEYRIEELARASGAAVDTIRFYQGKGLLPPPRREGRVTWYDDRHMERMRRIRGLQQKGFTLAVIRRFLDGELEQSDEALVAAVTAPAVPGEALISLDDLSARSGVAVPLLRALEQAGLLVPVTGAGEPSYRASDLTALAAGMKLIEAGIPLLDLLALAGEHAASTERTARRAVELFDQHVRERIQAEAGGAGAASATLLERFTELLEASGSLVEHHFRQTLLRVARDHIERGEEVSPATP